jgi:hypothetical protein
MYLTHHHPSRQRVGILSVLALLLLVIMSWMVFFAGIPAFGVFGAGVWAGLIFSACFIPWWLFSKVSGLLNLIIFVPLFCYGVFGETGFYNHTRNIAKVANYIRYDYSQHEAVKDAKLAAGSLKGENRNSELEHAYRKTLRDSWNNYGTFVNPWYTAERFEDAWREFYTWFNDHEYPKDGTPPKIPYFGDLDAIKDMAGKRLHALDTHGDEISREPEMDIQSMIARGEQLLKEEEAARKR